ncbi:KilA-N domain-containing protein [Halomonas sp. A40-4]|nr:KilA-N domain-containing protein [Halomonas sp. A40-4]
MTKAAKQFGKKLQNFMNAEGTGAYIEALRSNYPDLGDKDVVLVQRGSGLHPNVGTWAHPKLAVFFARWLDVRFAVACDARHQRIRFL